MENKGKEKNNPGRITVEDVMKQMRPFNNNYIISIPQSEMDVKPGLYTQNAGY